MNRVLGFLLFSFFGLSINAQSIDKVQAVIGDEIVLTSDFESQYLQYLSQGNLRSEQVRCEIIEDILFQKLLVNQAKIDSIVVNDEDVDDEINKRLNYFESQLGSIKEVEKYFKKSKVEIELELAKVINVSFIFFKFVIFSEFDFDELERILSIEKFLGFGFSNKFVFGGEIS